MYVRRVHYSTLTCGVLLPLPLHLLNTDHAKFATMTVRSRRVKLKIVISMIVVFDLYFNPAPADDRYTFWFRLRFLTWPVLAVNALHTAVDPFNGQPVLGDSWKIAWWQHVDLDRPAKGNKTNSHFLQSFCLCVFCKTFVPELWVTTVESP